MKPFALIVGTVIALSSAQSALGANYNFGRWQFTSGVGSRGTPYCGMISIVKNQNVGQNIIIKGKAGGLVVDLYRDKWIRRQGDNVRVAFDFIDNEPILLNTYADGHILEAEIPIAMTAEFMLRLAERPALQVVFPDDENEGTWVIGGQGAKAVVEKMTTCTLKLMHR